MPAFIVTYVLMQAAGGAASAAINAYLRNSQQKFHPHNGQETLYDEDNWARVLDIQQLLHLVRPFISAVQNLDISEIEAHVGRGSLSGRQFKVDEDSPPPYEDAGAFMSTQSYRIIRKTQELVQTLECAAGGPSGSSPRAWNLNVQASTEMAIELYALYCKTTNHMSTSSRGSLLNLVYAAMRLDDAALLAAVERRFQPVSWSSLCQLRLPADRRFLEIPGPIVEKSVGAKVVKGVGWTVVTPVAVIAGPVGWAVGGGYRTWRHFDKKKKLEAALSPHISKAGCSGSSLQLVHIPSQVYGGEKEIDFVCFGMVVHIALYGTGGELGLNASATKGSGLARVRLLHCDDRYQTRSDGRAICFKDRIILKDIDSGKLLSRRRLREDEWRVGFGVSDDNLWTVTIPL